MVDFGAEFGAGNSNSDVVVDIIVFSEVLNGIIVGTTANGIDSESFVIAGVNGGATIVVESGKRMGDTVDGFGGRFLAKITTKVVATKGGAMDIGIIIVVSGPRGFNGDSFAVFVPDGIEV